MELYLIYGLPGVGKLAVASELMRLRPGYRLFHIHLLADMLEPVFGFFSRLRFLVKTGQVAARGRVVKTETIVRVQAQLQS